MMERCKLKAPSMHAHFLLLYSVQKPEISSQNYDPVPCIHVEATHKTALVLPHGNFTMILTVQKPIVVMIL